MKVGTDPEFILMDKNKVPVSAVGILGHDKEEPMELEGGAVLEDGVMVELNVEPASDKESFYKNITSVKKQADAIFNPLGLYLHAIPFAKYDPKYLSDRKAIDSGCSVDYSIWNSNKYKPNKYKSYTETDYRYAGGHVHIEHDRAAESPNFREFLISCLDMYIKTPMKIVTGNNSPRDSMYGKLGNYRPKPYGLEYRSPDNSWLATEEGIHWMFNSVETAIMYSEATYRRGRGPQHVAHVPGLFQNTTREITDWLSSRKVKLPKKELFVNA